MIRTFSVDKEAGTIIIHSNDIIDLYEDDELEEDIYLKKDGDEEHICPGCNVIFYTRPGANYYDEYGCEDCGDGPFCPDCTSEGEALYD